MKRANSSYGPVYADFPVWNAVQAFRSQTQLQRELVHPDSALMLLVEVHNGFGLFDDVFDHSRDCERYYL